MPANYLHGAIDAGLRWFGGDSKAFNKAKEKRNEEDSAESSMKQHRAAREMGLESDSEDEYFDTNEPRRYREKGKYDPPTDFSPSFSPPFRPAGSDINGTSAPETSFMSGAAGPSRTSATPSYGAIDGYARPTWQNEGTVEPGQEHLPGQASPRAARSPRDNSQYPNSNLGGIIRPRGEHIPPASPSRENYIPPYRNGENSQVGSPRNADAFTAVQPYSSQARNPSSGNAHQSSGIRQTDQQGSSHSSRPLPIPRLGFDPVRDAIAQNEMALGTHKESTAYFPSAPDSSGYLNSRPSTSPYVVPTRKPVPLSRSKLQPTVEDEIDDSSLHYDEAERSKIRRQNEEEVIRERRDRNLRNSRKANQEANQRLPPQVPPKIPFSPIRRPSPSPRTATAPASNPTDVPLIPAPQTEDFTPNNDWPGNVNSPPYPLTQSANPRMRGNSVSSSAWNNNAQDNNIPLSSESPPYPVTPDNYHLIGYNNQNDIQNRAIHNAIKDTIRRGHTRMAGPTPLTSRSMYPDAVGIEDNHAQEPSQPRTTPRIGIPGLGRQDRIRGSDPRLGIWEEHGRFWERMSERDMESEERFATMRNNFRMGSLPSDRARTNVHSPIPEFGRWRSLSMEGEDRRRPEIPDIQVQHPTPGTSLRESQRGVGANMGIARSAVEAEPSTVPEIEHGRDQRREHGRDHERGHERGHGRDHGRGHGRDNRADYESEDEAGHGAEHREGRRRHHHREDKEGWRRKETNGGAWVSKKNKKSKK